MVCQLNRVVAWVNRVSSHGATCRAQTCEKYYRAEMAQIIVYLLRSDRLSFAINLIILIHSAYRCIFEL